MYSKTRGFLALVAVSACSLVLTSQTLAADSLAPPGAKRDWLPQEAWVMEHWLPYDEQQLFSTLGVSVTQVRAYFGGSKHPQVPTLAALAQSHGLDVAGLARRLLASWRPRVSQQTYAQLLDRTTRSLTQGHLMQHMLFHPFHDTAVFQASQRIFGVGPQQLTADLAHGMTRRQVGHQNARTDQQMFSAAVAVLRSEQAIGVRRHLTPPAEARRELADQTAALSAWLDEGGASANNPQTIFARSARYHFLCVH